MANQPFILSAADAAQIQALVGSGFGTLKHSEYVLLDIVDAALARAWVAKVWPCVWTIGNLGPQKEKERTHEDVRDEEAWTIAFTYRGLTLLGVVEDPQAPFPSSFKSGQADGDRRKLLREDPLLSWLWGDVAASARVTPPVSILVMRMHGGGVSPNGGLLATAGLAANGLRLVRRVHGSPGSVKGGVSGSGKKITYLEEPFGFRDGIGQPQVQGLQSFRTGGAALAAEADVPLGEFVLGYPNTYGDEAHCPGVLDANGSPAGRGFSRNGSYLAVQQILQDVNAFDQFERATRTGGNGPSVAEKMIGRRKNGCPLQEVPDALGPDDDFGYRVNDPHGMQCPIGAHIRRANPRDSVLEPDEVRPVAANLHRILRRSRPFASTGGPDDQQPPQQPLEVGMFFIAVNADLTRQFEFIKRAWIGSHTFGNLCGETDPLLGWGPNRHFTMPGQPSGTRQHGLPDLTKTQGGGYFFLPSLDTLKGIAAGDYIGPRELAQEQGGASD